MPAIIDVEASGFGSESYPIEVGVVLSSGSRFCRLIRPFDDWTHWDVSAENLHGISRQQIESWGVDGVDVCHALNRFIGQTKVYSDAWVVDHPWLLKLFYRAGIEMTFAISSLELIMREEQIYSWDEDKKFIQERSGLKRHRASTDACIIQETFKHNLLRHKKITKLKTSGHS